MHKTINYSAEQQSEMKIDSSDDDRESINNISSPFDIFNNHSQDDEKIFTKRNRNMF